MDADSEFRGKMPFQCENGEEMPSRAADYTLARASLELGRTRKDRTDRSTSMSAQLIRKVIRILEALISIILMLLHGKLVLFFHRQLREDKHGICGLLGIIGVRVGGEGCCGTV